MFAYPCPSCNQRLLAPAGRSGQRSICPKCLHPLTVPHPEQVAAGPFAPAPAEEFVPDAGDFAPPLVDAELDTPSPANTLPPVEDFPTIELVTASVTEPFLDINPVSTEAETKTPAPAPRPMPKPRSAPKSNRAVLRDPEGQVLLTPTGLFAVDVAAELIAAISMRMAPPPLPAADRTFAVIGWFAASTVGLVAWALGVWHSVAWLPYVALVGGSMVLCGLLWRAYLSGRGGSWMKGVATLLPPICLIQLFRPVAGHGRKPLLFALTGAALCGLFAAGPAAAKWVADNLDAQLPPPAVPQEEPVADKSEEKVEAVLTRLTSANKADRDAARKAVVRFGTKAEPGVRDLLASPDESTVLVACEVLEQVGTADMEPVLRKLADDPFTSRAVRIEATAAADAIQKRTGGK